MWMNADGKWIYEKVGIKTALAEELDEWMASLLLKVRWVSGRKT
jgi:hypothetical protein